MYSNRRFGQMAFRGVAISVLAALAVIIIISPAHAANSVADMDRGAIALIVAFGMLLLAIVFEVLRMTFRGQVPFNDRATHEWKPQKRHN
jgi:ABC-type nickel/cobalt efflux system permease component RcnA